MAKTKTRKPYVHRLEPVSAGWLRLWQRLDPEIWGLTKKTAAKKPAAIAKVAAAPKTNGHTHFDHEEQLRVQAARIHAAFNLESKGVTVDSLIEGVHQYEGPYKGVVQ